MKRQIFIITILFTSFAAVVDRSNLELIQKKGIFGMSNTEFNFGINKFIDSPFFSNRYSLNEQDRPYHFVCGFAVRFNETGYLG